MKMIIKTMGNCIIIIAVLHTLSQAGLFDIENSKNLFNYYIVKWGTPIILFIWASIPYIDFITGIIKKRKKK